MFSLSIAFGNLPVAWRFLFKDEDKAKSFYETLSHSPTQDLLITDDFGQHARIKAPSIHGMMLENLDDSKLGAIEMMLHNTKTQLDANKRAASDPIIRAGQAARGPSVMVPPGLNGFQ